MPDPRRVTVQSLWPEIAFATTVPLAISLQTRSFVPDRRHITAVPCGARVMNCAWMVPGPSVEKEIARVIPFGSRFESSLRSTNVSVAVGSDPGSDWLSGLDPAPGDALAFEPGDVAADAGADEAGAAWQQEHGGGDAAEQCDDAAQGGRDDAPVAGVHGRPICLSLGCPDRHCDGAGS